MKVLYVTTGCFDKGGISRYSRYQITALRELYGEDQVKVISFLGPEEDAFEIPFKVDWHGSKNTLAERFCFIGQVLIFTLRFQPLIIHVAHVNYSFLAYYLSFLSRASVIVNIYGLEIWTGLNALKRYGLRNAHCVISDCHSTADYVVGKNLVQVEKVKVIWDCVNTDFFKPFSEVTEEIIKKYNLPSKSQHFIINTLGRISEDAAYKGYDRLLTSFATLHRKYNTLRLIMIGKGNLIPFLQQQATNLEVATYVHFTGSVEEHELPLLLSYGHVFSLVTISGTGQGEGLPLTPLEAMACGLPIIVGNQDGSREAIIDNVNGYCIDPENPAEHIRVLEELIVEPEQRQKKASGALRIVQEHFSYPVFREKHKELYHLIVKKNEV